MLDLILKRLAVTVPTLLALTFILFSMVKAVPGDPAQLLLGDRASAESLKAIRAELGLDKPFLVQYGIYMKKLILERDLGRSIKSEEKISEIIAAKLPATFELAVGAMIIACFVGIPIGMLASYKPGSVIDFSVMAGAVTGLSMPVFWLGLLLMLFFGLELGWFPISGRLAVDYYYEQRSGFLLFDSLFYEHDFEMFKSALSHLALPALTLATIPTAFLARMTRSSMLESLSQDYIRTAKSKGLSFAAIYGKHAFKNASLPIVTVLGLQFGTLLGGAMITETIFSWPGMGRWILESVSARDFPAIVGGVMVVASCFIFINLIVDIGYKFIDPRMRQE